MRFSTLLVIASAVAMFSGCSSEPTKEGGAPVQEGKPSRDGGPDTGKAPTTGPNTVDLTKQPPAAKVDDELTNPKSTLSRRSIYFDFDSYTVKDEFRALLQAHATYVVKTKAARMLVQGNADERGSREYNLALGQRRAEAVKRTLVLLGAPESQIEAVCLGKEKPRRIGHTEEDYAENRRADMLYNSGNVKEF
jgi:peptidoglycan-associated lipoprotein